ncbi:MAG TPA: carboxypeptidase-like regulatory domain-containing protein [Candidatus Cloacimonadota bacterium]|mgnify:CR=1 FL=1|nr:carboxypeptidase-like regulatory domain-containing protein [Candidatus Cloacimonadota bacterium]HPT71717.1 carboxypeptidase-like regulatory domain-containing protein [Candidatus Cloacimonadota bacterium]
MKNLIFLLGIVILITMIGCSQKDTQAPYSYDCSLDGHVVFSGMSADSIHAVVSVYPTGQNQLIAEANTDSTGYYHFENMTNIAVDIRIEADRYDTQFITGVSLANHETVTANTVTLLPLPQIEIRTPLMNGVIETGWSPAYENTYVSNWGASNEMKNLYLARDADSLYIALTGSFATSENCVNIYLDKDYGNNTGLSNFYTISGGSIGDHLRKDVSCPSSFGADIAFTVWQLSSDVAVVNLAFPTAVDQNQLSTVRKIVKVNIATDDVLELSIPLNVLYSNGIVPTNTKIAIIALIGGGGDQYISNDTIPMQAIQDHSYSTTDPFVFSSVYRIKM